MSDDSKITLVLLGGTIDAEPYKVTPENITALEKSIIPETIEKLGFKDKCDIHEGYKGDSNGYG